MPINMGGPVKGAGGILGVPCSRMPVRTIPFRSQSFAAYQASITGVTRDSTGAALGVCTVNLFRTLDNSFRSSVVSDASGNYVLYPDVTGPFYIEAYKPGAPDVAGTTVNTLLPI